MPLSFPTAATSPSGVRVPWHHRLETRVAVGVTILVGLALGAVLLATNRIVRTNALNRAAIDLEAARGAFYHLIDSRSQSSAAQLRMVTELPSRLKWRESFSL